MVWVIVSYKTTVHPRYLEVYPNLCRGLSRHNYLTMELRRAENTPELGPDQDNLRHVVITATCFALTLSTVSVALRLLCRRITKTKVFLDDYLIIVALVGCLSPHTEQIITIPGIRVWNLHRRRRPYVLRLSPIRQPCTNRRLTQYTNSPLQRPGHTHNPRPP